MKHIIIGTAGHIDHGKTALIRALTGRNTDTLKEERDRGISINLGFTYFDLPSGKRAGIVDVPGHEKFIKNMLAGASGIDLVLLVIAADEGVMPQTREHLNILSLLNITRGIVVVTKKDLVDDEWLGFVIDDIRGFVKGTFLENADIVPVSSVTGEGIEELTARIDALSDQVSEKGEEGFFRLPVDRAFTISGFGTVVTGTLISGSISVGDRAAVYPSGQETRVRNIQVHDQQQERAYPGQRAAINLSNVKLDEISRGNVVASKGCIEPSMMIDCRLLYLKDAPKPLQNRDRVRVYHGTSEIMGRVVILDREVLKPGETCLAQMRLEGMMCARKGDRFVIRTYSPMVTIGGGSIIDPHPPKRKRFLSRDINELLTKEKGSPEEVIEHVLLKNSRFFPDADTVSKLSGFGTEDTRRVMESLKEGGRAVSFLSGDGECYAHRDYIADVSEAVTRGLRKFHAENPLQPGMMKEEIKSRIFENSIKQRVFDGLLKLLEDKKLIKSSTKYVSLYGFGIALSPVQDRIRSQMIRTFDLFGFNVPKPDDALGEIDGPVSEVRMVFQLLLDQGELIRINGEMVISSKNYRIALDKLTDFIKSNGEITLAQYRTLLNTSRKYAVSLLEYFDQTKITKRVGDNRLLN